TLTTTDPDSGDTHTYTLENSGCGGGGFPDNSSFQIGGVGNDNLQSAASFNFEAQSAYSICVRSTDSTSRTFEKQFTISVTDVNEAPTDISLSSSSVAENQASGTTVGTLSDTDPDVGDTAAFSLVSGPGSTDNGSFSITGNTLKTSASFDYETKNSY